MTLGIFIEIRRENPEFAKIEQKYRALYVKTSECCTVASDIKPLKLRLTSTVFKDSVRTAQ
jgi:hypothetical protein